MPRITRSSVKAEKDSNAAEKRFKKSHSTRKRKSSSSSSSETENLSPNKSSKVENLEESPGIADCLANKLSLEAPKISKFSSARRALAANENLRLPGREKQFEELAQIINEAITTKTSSSLYINGPPG